MSRLATIFLLSALSAIAFLGISAPAQAALTGFNPCTGGNNPTYPWMGDMYGVEVTVPSIATSGPTEYSGVVFGPAAPEAIDPSTAKRPAIVFQHGASAGDGNWCAMVWAAKYLAGNGYITGIHQAPDAPGEGGQLLNGIRATASAVEFMRSPANPYAAITDTGKIAAGGSSMGSIVSSYIQGNPPPTDEISLAAGLDISNLDVATIIAFDNLRHWLSGDPGAAAAECNGETRFPVIPRVPALGFAMDNPCSGNPTEVGEKLKQPGWAWWRENGVPSLQLVLRDFEHTDFSANGDQTQRLTMAYWVKRWYDRWLMDQPELEAELLAPTVNGSPTADLLSTTFHSAACLGQVDTSDYASFIAGSMPQPANVSLGHCQTPEAPTDLRVVGGSPARSTLVRIRGTTNSEADIRIFDNRTCEGKPVVEGSGLDLNRGEMKVTVKRGSRNVFRAIAVNPWHGQVSGCSTSSASYRQADPDLHRPNLRLASGIRAGKTRILRVTVRNGGLVDARNVKVRIDSSNRGVRVPKQKLVRLIEAKSTKVLTVRVRARSGARGKAVIKVGVGGRKSVRTLRIRR